jgi:uncharacterized NAD(P)/FAD-binding protein YdhS
MPGAGPETFAPRRLFGQYLKDVLEESAESFPGAFYRHIRAEAIGAEARDGGARLLLTNGSYLQAERVVLALGNPASCLAPGLATSGMEHRWHASPWLGDALRVRFAGERILIVGSGLTAVDAAAALQRQELPCKIHMVSRQGILPQVHDLRVRGTVLPPLAHRGNLRGLVREIRHHIRAAADADLCWRSIVDALRPLSNAVWQELSPADQRRFQRHLKRYWEPHRHRMAAEVLERLAEHRASGALEVLQGRIQGADEIDGVLGVLLRLRGGQFRRITVDRIISCTGVVENYHDSPRPLVRSLLANGLARVHFQGSGFVTDAYGALMDAEMRPSRVFYTLGPPRRGQLFETTAVPEIRQQAEALALVLAACEAVPELADYCI